MERVQGDGQARQGNPLVAGATITLPGNDWQGYVLRGLGYSIGCWSSPGATLLGTIGAGLVGLLCRVLRQSESRCLGL
jgi:hypothetical protein